MNTTRHASDTAAGTSRADGTARTALVCGATGRQGGAVVRRLLADGWRVRGLTRDPASPAARGLAEAGVRVVRGDADDRDSLAAAVAGAYGVFSVQRGSLSGHPLDPEDEIRQAVNLAEAALAAGVRHLVHSSVAGADPAAPSVAFATKGRVEERVRAVGVPLLTVLRPVSFMENYTDPGFGVPSGTIATPWAQNLPEQLVALADIGAFAALALADPSTYGGRTVEIAGDALTPPETAAALSAAISGPIQAVPVALDAIRAASPDVADAFAYLHARGGYGVDIPAVRALHPGLLSFADWLRGDGGAAVRALVTGVGRNAGAGGGRPRGGSRDTAAAAPAGAPAASAPGGGGVGR